LTKKDKVLADANQNRMGMDVPAEKGLGEQMAVMNPSDSSSGHGDLHLLRFDGVKCNHPLFCSSDGEAKMAVQMEKTEEQNLSFSPSSTRSISSPSQSERDGSNFQNSLQKRLQTKIVEFAKHYNEESIEAVTNFFADILSFATLWFLLVRLEIQINITKSFLLEVFFGLDDSKKSLLILFITDLLVGYHSPNIWELFFQTLFDHYGLPESQTTIFLLVATLPVLLDVLFKYLIFRHLNRASPATVATYHAMIE
jgi:hypothetical protein